MALLNDERNYTVSLMLRTLHRNSLRSAREIPVNMAAKGTKQRAFQQSACETGLPTTKYRTQGGVLGGGGIRPICNYNAYQYTEVKETNRKYGVFFLKGKGPNMSPPPPEKPFILFFKNFQDSLSKWTSILEWTAILTIEARWRI